jgi:thiamine-phosphate pyrophosphorylase
MARIPAAPFLYPITDRGLAGEADIIKIIEALCWGGARFIQIREKDLTTREYTEFARRCVEAAMPFGAAIIVNDRPDVAKYAGAAGVHLGDDELTAGNARKFLGSDAVIGVSCHTSEDIQRAQSEPIDYFAVGPVFPTDTKELRYEVVGLELVRAARRMSDLPMVAIGGISAEAAAAVVKAGADGIALIGAVMRGDIERNTRALIDALHADKNE